ncbi:MAG TPA: hypothetical protein VHS27_04540 [Gaiellales bacterium]|jgi:hypothetical protein|nr:hypothetical protein [Gaiellales bacterium]
MTAYSLGQRGVTGQVAPDSTIDSFIGRVIRWIPTDIIALYTAGISLLAQAPAEVGAKWLLIGFIILAPIAVVLGAWTASTSGGWFTNKIKFRTAFAPIAFVIWSPSVPSSGWQEWHVVNDHPRLTVVVCGVVAYVFAQIAHHLDPET